VQKARTRVAIVALVVVGCSATALLAYSRGRLAAGRDPRPAEVASPDGEAERKADARISALERQVAVLANLIAAREQDFKDVGELSAARKRDDADRTREAAEKAIPMRERAAQALADMFATLDRQLEGSTPDPAWRPEPQARDVLNGVAGTRIVNLRCGPAHCRVELAFATEDERGKLADEIQTKPPFSEGVAFRADPETPLKTVLYFQRPGIPLGDAS
jgi:hypothetical protein